MSATPGESAKAQLQRLAQDLSEQEAAALLQLLQLRGQPAAEVTRLLDGLSGTWAAAQRGLAEAQAGQTVSLEQLRRRASP